MLLSILLYAASAAAVNFDCDVRVIGGYKTTIEEHPHQVSLQSYKEHFCGGSILNERLIITAAHCLIWKEPDGVQIRVGSTYHGRGGDLFKVEKVIRSPNFTRETQDYDVGFLVIQRPLVFGVAVQPIKLVPLGYEPRHGDMLTSTGWGTTTLDPYDFKLSPVLQAIRLPKIDLKLCREAYTSSPKNITENMLCAGGAINRLIFRGDSGGPLINDKKQLVGIVSWGRSENPIGFPSIFANLASPSIRAVINDMLNGTIVY